MVFFSTTVCNVRMHFVPGQLSLPFTKIPRFAVSEKSVVIGCYANDATHLVVTFLVRLDGGDLFLKEMLTTNIRGLFATSMRTLPSYNRPLAPDRNISVMIRHWHDALGMTITASKTAT